MVFVIILIRNEWFIPNNFDKMLLDISKNIDKYIQFIKIMI